MAGIFVLKMKKNYGFALISIFLLCLTFCGCDLSKLSPWKGKEVQNNDSKPQQCQIYVCGAVENEGYYYVTEGETYFDAISQAGLLAQSSLPSISSRIVNTRVSFVVVPYRENGAVHECINANHPFFSARLPMEGLTDGIVNKIADYLETYGAIHNKNVLSVVLGEQDYANYHYKLYIAEADYEKVD